MKRKYIILLLVVILLVVGLIALRQYNKWHYKKYQANIDENHGAMKYFVDESHSFVRIAFSRLESEFEDPNIFNLQTYSVRTRDSIVLGILDTINIVYFTYFLNNDSNKNVFPNCLYLGIDLI